MRIDGVHTSVNAARKSACATRGTALLAVLWLSAALSAIAFTVANTVRGETERTSTDVDGLKASYLAAGALDRALLYIQWGPGPRNADGTAKYFQNPMPVMRFEFPTGSAAVEIIPDSAKLSVNTAPPEELMNLLQALGVGPDQAQGIVGGILDWRSPSAGGSFTQYDQHYLSLTPSFRSRHASFQEIEELLLVQGVTPDLFYGSYTHDGQGHLTPHAALRDCLSVYGSKGLVDVNTAEPAVMQAVGISANAAAAIVNMRRAATILDMQQIGPFVNGTAGAGRLGIAPTPIINLRATARLRLSNGQLSDVRRSASAMVKILGPDWDVPFHIMRWSESVVLPQ